MKYSQTELKIVREVGEGNNKTKSIASAIKKSDMQVYRDVKRLKEEGFLESERGIIKLKAGILNNLITELVTAYPNLIPLISGSGILVLGAVTIPRDIDEITKITCLKKSIIYKKLKQAYAISVVRKENKKYTLNRKIWRRLNDFLIEAEKYEENVDPRIPANSIIYYKNKKEIVFSNKGKLNAMPTAFSVYTENGIKLFLTENYYYLPKRRLPKREIFLHSLYIIQKEKSIRHIIYAALFYLKFKNTLKGVKNAIIENILKVLEGKKIEGYPSLEEIKEKAGIYDIKV